MSDWKKRATPVQPAKSSWRDRAEPIKQTSSPVVAGVRALVQGVSGGFGDELAGGIGGAIDYAQGEGDFASLYEKNRDEQRAKNEMSQKDWPKTYGALQLGGAAVPTVMSGGVSIPAMAASGAAQGIGYSDADLTKGDIAGVAKDAAIGGTIGAGAGAAVQGVSKIAPTVVKYLSGKMGKFAEDRAVNATGATGLQASKFAPGTGRELLDRGIVRGMDTAENIADRAGNALRSSGDEISAALTKLDDVGATASVDNVVAVLESKVAELSKVPGNETLIRQLTGEIDNLMSRGQSSLPVSLAEKAKRNYQSNVNYASPESDKKAAKYLASAFKDEVEQVASKADPAVAKDFMAAKKSYGILSPVEEAATRRANVLNQSPTGGLGDMAAAGVGGAPGLIAKNFVFPRISSTMAVGADSISKALAATPEIFGKYAGVLQNAAAKGAANLAITHQVLQKDPEYQATLQNLPQ
jgi:hypothetical protein